MVEVGLFLAGGCLLVAGVGFGPPLIKYNKIFKFKHMLQHL